MEEIKILADTGVDLVNKMFQITGDIDRDMYDHVVTSLYMLLNYQGQSTVEGYDEKPITIMLSTYGGEVYYAFAIYDLIKNLAPTTRIVCNGPVMSAGSLILQAGGRRIMMPNSDILIHFGSQSVDDTKTKHHYDQITRRMRNVFAERTQVPSKTVGGWFKKESYFDATMALEKGLVDEVHSVET